REPPDARPAGAGLGGDLVELRPDHLVVGLVLEVLHARAALGVVADRATEEHDGATVRPDAPVVDAADRELGVGQTEPVVAVGRRVHGRHRSRGTRGRDVPRCCAFTTIWPSWSTVLCLLT